MLEFLQRIGRSLMVPIAVMPAAALLNRLGAPDVLNLPFIQAAGSEIFVYLPLLFAAGIAIGMTSDKRGEAVLAAVIGYFVLIKALGVLLVDIGNYAPDAAIVSKLSGNPLLGIVAGLVSTLIYARFRDFRLPEALGFFSGRRLVPIVTSVAMLVVGLVLALVWPLVWDGLASANQLIAELGAIGAAIFGFLNRLLIPLGLHHVMNSFFWFTTGEYVTAEGAVVVGDIPRFLAGDPSAGVYQVGFYPVMMGGLIGAALAMIRAAKPENRRKVAGILGSAALVSFVTGITEPIEFAFVFVAPMLYGIHALLTGLSMYVTASLGLTHGFGFSAGLIDYVLNFGLAHRPLVLAGITVVFFGLYFVVFSVVIRLLNIPTVGREDDVSDTGRLIDADLQLGPASLLNDNRGRDSYAERAAIILAAVGGRENIKTIDSCATRLRLSVHDSGGVDERALQRAGAKGVIRPSKHAVQVIIGGDVQFIADALTRCVAEQADSGQRPAGPATASTADVAAAHENGMSQAGTSQVDIEALVAGLGGLDNIETIVARSQTRLRVHVRDGDLVDEAGLRTSGVCGVLRRQNRVDLLAGPHAAHMQSTLQGKM